MSEKLFACLASPFTGEELFDQLSDIVYFVKNRQGRYEIVNRTLVERSGAREKRDLLGRTASEVSSGPLGALFEEQDLNVIRSGKPILSQLELHAYPSWDLGWCLTTKIPLRDAQGGVLGLVGVSQDLRSPARNSDGLEQIRDALEHAQNRLGSPPSVEELAGVAGMSRYQFDRRMQIVFSLTTRQWLVKLRVGAAESMLRDTDEPIATVAQAVGYSDQSAFSRQFLKTTGLTPMAYRAATRRSG